MRKISLLLLVIALTPVLAVAQSSEQRRLQGYVFAAPGGISAVGNTAASLHAGIGGEGLLYKGLGAGAEVGYLFPTRAAGDGIGIFSANGSYHFVGSSKPRKVVPFVTAGYSRAFGQGGFNMINYGGGVNWWMRDRLGLRLEARDHVTTDTPRGHFWQFRVALAFR